MNSKQFLLWGGIILVVVGLLGWWLLGPTPEASIFGSTWWFDNGENWAHLVLGIVALIAAYALPASGQKPLVMVLGVVAVLIGLYSLLLSSGGSAQLLGSSLENPADSILHLVVGAWALWASMRHDSSMM